jgi:hypothetical protein
MNLLLDIAWFLMAWFAVGLGLGACWVGLCLSIDWWAERDQRRTGRR